MMRSISLLRLSATRGVLSSAPAYSGASSAAVRILQVPLRALHSVGPVPVLRGALRSRSLLSLVSRRALSSDAPQKFEFQAGEEAVIDNVYDFIIVSFYNCCL
jgi:hypothetical protein